MEQLRRVLPTILVTVAFVIVIAMLANNLKSRNDQIRLTKQALFNASIDIVTSRLQYADNVFAGGTGVTSKGMGLSQASVFIAQAAGALMGVQRAARVNGVDHLLGIGDQLQQIANVFANPNGGYDGEIERDKQFVHTAAIQFRSALDSNWHVDPAKLKTAVDKIYQTIDPAQRQRLYNSGP